MINEFFLSLENFVVFSFIRYFLSVFNKFGMILLFIINLYFKLFLLGVVVFDDFLLEWRLLLNELFFDCFVLVGLFVFCDLRRINFLFLLIIFFNSVEFDLDLVFLKSCLWDMEFKVEGVVVIFLCFCWVLDVGDIKFVGFVVFFWFLLWGLVLLNDKLIELVRFF